MSGVLTRSITKVFRLVAAAVPLALLAMPAGAQMEDFTFIHATDLHAPMTQSREVLSTLEGLDTVNMSAFGLEAKRPSFAIASGDLTEFGGGNGIWQEYLSYWQPSGLPVFHNLGNHDNTWHAELQHLREIGQAPYYSFDSHGAHFIALMSATIQDPRPSFGEEQIVWLKQDLESVEPTTPVFVTFHHPIGGSEFASSYDWRRVLDVLRPYNVVIVMTGHSHGSVGRLNNGVHEVIGGTTFNADPKRAGVTFVSVQDDMLRVAYWPSDADSATNKVLEKKIDERSNYPTIEILSPEDGVQTTSALEVKASLSGVGGIEKVSYVIDDAVRGELPFTSTPSAYDKAEATGTVDCSELLPGSHNLRLEFTKGDQTWDRSIRFYVEKDSRPTAWRRYLAAASKGTPALSDGRVYIGANNGVLYAYEASTGDLAWTQAMAAEIVASPLVVGNSVVAADGTGQVLAFDKANGRKLWSFSAPDSVYSSPILAGDKIVFGCNDGSLFALDADTGRQAWRNQDAEYSIESTPWATGGRVYFGAWDQYVRCVDASNGKLIWKQMGEGSRTAPAAKRYYSPGDAMPVVAGGKVYIADRKYTLGIHDAATGEVLGSMEGVAATGVSEDGKYVYLRMVAGDLVKMDTEGNEIWRVDAGLNAVPTAPLEKSGIVYVASATGTVSAVSARFGSIIWQYQASPKLFIMSSVASDGNNAYVTAFDGNLTAIEVR